MCSPADASPPPSRVPAHGLGPMQIATPSPWKTFTSYSLPVLIGAPKILNSAAVVGREYGYSRRRVLRARRSAALTLRVAPFHIVAFSALQISVPFCSPLASLGWLAACLR